MAGKAAADSDRIRRDQAIDRAWFESDGLNCRHLSKHAVRRHGVPSSA